MCIRDRPAPSAALQASRHEKRLHRPHATAWGILRARLGGFFGHHCRRSEAAANPAAPKGRIRDLQRSETRNGRKKPLKGEEVHQAKRDPPPPTPPNRHRSRRRRHLSSLRLFALPASSRARQAGKPPPETPPPRDKSRPAHRGHPGRLRRRFPAAPGHFGPRT